MKRLLVVGAGGHGAVVADAALSTGDWGTVAFVDDRAAELVTPLGLEVVGTTKELPGLVGQYDAAVVAIGDADIRLRVLEACGKLRFLLPVIAHRSSVISPFATLSPGCVVFAQAVVNPGARLGRACIVNTAASIDHDCELDDGVHVCPGAHLAGNVRVGASTWIGIGAVVREGITVGNNVVVAAGSVVVKDVECNVTVMGVPARRRM